MTKSLFALVAFALLCASPAFALTLNCQVDVPGNAVSLQVQNVENAPFPGTQIAVYGEYRYTVSTVSDPDTHVDYMAISALPLDPTHLDQAPISALAPMGSAQVGMLQQVGSSNIVIECTAE
jgi:hypothetical protein